MEVLEESGLEPHIKSDPFLPQTCDILFSALSDTNQAVIVLPQPSDFVELLSERLHVLDADSLELNLCDKISGFRSTDISPLDTKLFSDSGAESDDSGFHSFTDVSFFTERRSLIDEDDMMDNVLYTINVNDCGDDIDDEEGDEDGDESDSQSDSSSGSSDDDSGSSSDEMDDESDEDHGKDVLNVTYFGEAPIIVTGVGFKTGQKSMTYFMDGPSGTYEKLFGSAAVMVLACFGSHPFKKKD